MTNTEKVWSLRENAENCAEFVCSNKASERDWFSVGVRSRLGCVMMSPWLFNVYMNGVVREVNARVLRRRFKLVGVEWERIKINQLVFGDDRALYTTFSFLSLDPDLNLRSVMFR